LTDKADREIWTFARANDYILVTFDSDFYDLSVTFGSPPKLIWITSGNLTTRRAGDLLIARVDDIRAFFHDPEFTCLALQ
jgi:predicted nuclease of predicted toxin-antitoxin system